MADWRDEDDDDDRRTVGWVARSVGRLMKSVVIDRPTVAGRLSRVHTLCASLLLRTTDARRGTHASADLELLSLISILSNFIHQRVIEKKLKTNKQKQRTTVNLQVT